MTPFNTFRRNLTIKRRGKVEYDETGLAVIGNESILTVKGSVQPASGNEITQTAGAMVTHGDENRRNLEAYVVYTNSELVISDQATATQGDLITIHGRDFEITALRSWQNGIINHNAYIAQGVML